MMIGEVGTDVEYATIAHSVTGRIRLKVPSLRDNEWRQPELERLARESEQIEYLAVRPATRSLVVEYDPDATSAERVLGELCATLALTMREREAVRAEPFADGERVAREVRDLVGRANSRVAATLGGIDLRILVPGTLFFLSLGAVLGARRRDMPGWHTMLWYAYNLFDKLNPPGPRALERDSA